jgi:hypothetical protein
MYQHASLRSVNKRLPTDDAARALAFLFACDALLDSAAADARRLVRAAAAAPGATADDAARAVRAVLDVVAARWPGCLGGGQSKAAPGAGDENAFAPQRDDSKVARSFVCRVFVQKATCVAQAPTKNRLNSVLTDGAAWFASLAAPTAPFAGCAPIAAATFVHAVADVAIKCGDADGRLVALCSGLASAVLAGARDAPAAAALVSLAQQRLSLARNASAAIDLAALGDGVAFSQIADGEFLFEFVLGLEALRSAAGALAAPRSHAASQMCALLDAAIARGAALERASGSTDGRFGRLALKRQASVAAADNGKLLAAAISAAEALTKQPKASSAEALAALQSAARAADGEARAQAKVGSTAFNCGIALYSVARFAESCDLLAIAASSLRAALRSLRAAAAPVLPYAQTSKAYFTLALAHRSAQQDASAVGALQEAFRAHPLLRARGDDADDDALAELRPLVQLYCELEQSAPLHEFIGGGGDADADDGALPLSVVAALLELQLTASAAVPSLAGDARIRLFEVLIDLLAGSDVWAARRFTARGRLAAALHELDEGEPLAVLDAAIGDARRSAAVAGLEQATAQLHAWRALLAFEIEGELDVDAMRAALSMAAAAVSSGRAVAALAPACAELFDSLADVCTATLARTDFALECRAASVRCWECVAAYDWPSARAPSAVAHVQWATALALRGCRTAAGAMFARVEAFLEASQCDGDGSSSEDDDSSDAVDDAAELAECAAFARLRAAVLTQPEHAHATACDVELPPFSSAASAASYDAERLLALACAERSCPHAAERAAAALSVEASMAPLLRARSAFDSARKAHARAAHRCGNSLAWSERTGALWQFEALLALGRGYECCTSVDEAVSCYAKAASLAEQLQFGGHWVERAAFFVSRVRALSAPTATTADAPPELDSALIVAAGVRGLESLLLAVDQGIATAQWAVVRSLLLSFDACLNALVVQNAQVLRSLDAPDADARAAADFCVWRAAGDMRRAIAASAATADVADCRALLHEHHVGPLSCRDLAMLQSFAGKRASAVALVGATGDAALLPRAAVGAAIESVKLVEKRGFELVPAMLQHLASGISIRHRALAAAADEANKLPLSKSGSDDADVGSLDDLFEDMSLEPSASAMRVTTAALRRACSFGDAALAAEATGSAAPPSALGVKLQAWLQPVAAMQRAHRWALVTVSVAPPACADALPSILISRREPSGETMYVVRHGVDVAKHVAAFSALLADSSASMKAADSEPEEAAAAAASSSSRAAPRKARATAKSHGEALSREEKNEWWKARRDLDERLRALLHDLERDVFGAWICMAEGRHVSGEADGDTALIEKAAKQLGAADNMTEELLRRLVDSSSAAVTADALRDALRECCRKATDANVDKVHKVLLKRKQAASAGERHAVVLVLDDLLQLLPIESLPSLRSTSMSRLPSMALGRALCERAAHDEQRACDSDKLYYVLNPAGDLVNTQKRFEAFVIDNGAWSGHIGTAPTEASYLEALRQRDVVVYMGHNCAERIAAPPAVSKLATAGGANAVVWMLGCSSARLERRGAFGVHGSAVAYLVAGCPAFVGFLWDVTDGEADRFSKAALSSWLDGGVSLADAVRAGRDKCLMTALNGAASVVYGLPHWTCCASAAVAKKQPAASRKRTS